MGGSEPALPSKSEINRCGAYLVDLTNAAEAFDLARFERSWGVVADYRAAHSYPLTKVTMGLRSMVKTAGCPIVVSQRLKRLPRIVRKLERMQNSNLARLEDIGGCRAVLRNGGEVTAVYKRMRKNWASEIVRERNYVDEPKIIGYRAMHMVVLRDERRIEVQLRTEAQQRWADAIEAADSRLGLNLKDGVGPVEMVEFFVAGGEVSHAYDYGLEVTDDMRDRLEAARQAVVDAGYYTR